MSFLQTFRQSTSCLRRTCLRYSSTAEAPSKKAAFKKDSAADIKSSCPADTVLSGLNYLKGQPAVLALPEDQYPPWLWTVLKAKEYPDDGPAGKGERVKRRHENKIRIKETNFMKTQ
ncbi:mitochondrial ribosomal protein L37-domain-containing protein [Cyathus striatus]|nr:mitochondrial ribosomal protein L37-domain-containing protein [Cyathus striatus]